MSRNLRQTYETEPKTAGDVVSVSCVADDESAETENSLVPVTSILCPLVTSSFDSLVDNMAEEDALENDTHKNLNESDPAGDAGLSDSLLIDAVSTGYSSVSVPKYQSSFAISSAACVISLAFTSYLPVSVYGTTSSIRENRYQEIGNVTETQNFMSDLWPPDLIHKIKKGKFVW